MSGERAERRRCWGEAAKHWAQNADVLGRLFMPVAVAMIEAVGPQPGQRILELAAGTGEVGFLAAELIQPGGELICSDFAPEMLSAAQERAAERNLGNIRFKQIDAESIDIQAGSIDAVLCRWGYMLMTDPGAALRETRRVLRPGGRLAFAVWADESANPQVSVLTTELVRRGALEPEGPDEPGPFRWSDPARIGDELATAGFVDDLEIAAVDLEFPFADFDTWWIATTQMSARSRAGLAGLDDAGTETLRAAVRERLAPHTLADGALRIPARTWVASATA